MSKFKSKSNETRVRSNFQTVQFTPGSYHFESAEERRLFLILSIVWSWDCWVHVLLTDTRHAVKSHIIILLRWGIGIFLHIVNLYVHYICVKWRECCLILTKRRHGMFDRLIYKSTIIAEKSLLSCIFAENSSAATADTTPNGLSCLFFPLSSFSSYTVQVSFYLF